MVTGQLRFGYIPRKSFVHRLDPLTKLVVLMCVAILTVTLVSDLAALTTFVFLLLAYTGANISLRQVVGRFRRLVAFILLIALIQLFFTSHGILLFYLIPSFAPGIGPFLPITTAGIANALILSLRLTNIVLASALFVATVDPTLLSIALTRLRIPYRYSFLLVLALRLVPLFDQEVSIVQNAQRTRGIPVDRGVLRGFFTQLRYTFLPLIVSALSRVDTLTLAMDGRGFGYTKTRTYHRRPKYTSTDWFITLTCLLLSIFLLWHFTFIAPLPQILIPSISWK